MSNKMNLEDIYMNNNKINNNIVNSKINMKQLILMNFKLIYKIK